MKRSQWALQFSERGGNRTDSMPALTLTPMAAGTSRIRFVGKILGNERIFEVVVEAAPAKKKE